MPESEEKTDCREYFESPGEQESPRRDRQSTEENSRTDGTPPFTTQNEDQLYNLKYRKHRRRQMADKQYYALTGPDTGSMTVENLIMLPVGGKLNNATVTISGKILSSREIMGMGIL